MKFLCFRCGDPTPAHLMALDTIGRRVCIPCYLENPSRADVDGVFAEVCARLEREARSEQGGRL